MFKTETHYYKGASSDLTECFLNNTVAESTPKKINESILGVALTILKERHNVTKQRLEINGFLHPKEARVLDGQIKKYTENLDSIFERFGLSSTEGSSLLYEMQDKGGKNV